MGNNVKIRSKGRDSFFKEKRIKLNKTFWSVWYFLFFLITCNRFRNAIEQQQRKSPVKKSIFSYFYKSNQEEEEEDTAL